MNITYKETDGVGGGEELQSPTHPIFFVIPDIPKTIVVWFEVHIYRLNRIAWPIGKNQWRVQFHVYTAYITNLYTVLSIITTYARRLIDYIKNWEGGRKRGRRQLFSAVLNQAE